MCPLTALGTSTIVLHNVDHTYEWIKCVLVVLRNNVGVKD
jgi:hypothetical protein